MDFNVLLGLSRVARLIVTVDGAIMQCCVPWRACDVKRVLLLPLVGVDWVEAPQSLVALFRVSIIQSEANV